MFRTKIRFKTKLVSCKKGSTKFVQLKGLNKVLWLFGQFFHIVYIYILNPCKGIVLATLILPYILVYSLVLGLSLCRVWGIFLRGLEVSKSASGFIPLLCYELSGIFEVWLLMRECLDTIKLILVITEIVKRQKRSNHPCKCQFMASEIASKSDV